ncbi:MAG TPA: divergent polysaccharide deacetylase family protein [Caulobacteraceae bacterium]|nr:divergent polysaccharide deacetylase family protein [Caulobacteraceae bacterium]
MFAKRRPALAAGPETAAAKGRFDPRALLETAKRPPVAAAAAGAFFLVAGVILVGVIGDPRAGAPSVRASIARPKPAAAPAPTGLEAFTIDSLGMFQDLAVPGFELNGDAGPVQGTAVITLPDSEQAMASVQAPPRRPAADPLPAAPIAGVIQQGPQGPLPVIAPDGRTPFSAYARPFKSDGRPKVALIVGGLGLNAPATKAAIERLPAEVTLSFVPYADGLQGWIDLARAHGHEVLLEIPMEPIDYPDNDPGPYTLLADAPPADTARRLDWLMSRATGYFGVTNYLGGKFMVSDGGMDAFLSALKSRGLAFYDDGTARKRQGAWARASADRVVDEQLTAAGIVEQLNALEAAAKARGSALGAGFAYPVTVEVAARWADGLKARGLQLAPASAVARR